MAHESTTALVAEIRKPSVVDLGTFRRRLADLRPELLQISEQASKWQQLLARVQGYEEDPDILQLLVSLSQTFQALQRHHDKAEKIHDSLAIAVEGARKELARFADFVDGK